MNDTPDQGQERTKAPRRAAVGIDLAKTDVKDVTPPVEAAEPAAAERPAVEIPAPSPPPAETPTVRSGGTMPVVGGAIAGAIFGLLGVSIHQNIQAPPVTVADPRVAAVEGALVAAEKKIADAQAIETRLRNDIQALTARAKAAEDSAAAADKRAAEAASAISGVAAPLDERLKSAEAKAAVAVDTVGALERRLEQLGQVQAPKLDLSPLESRIEGLEKALGSAGQRLTSGADAAALLEARLKQAEQALASLKAGRTADAATATLATTALVRRALEGGEALGTHIAALHAQGVPEALTRPLLPFADKPAPRLSVLADQLGELAAKLPKPVAEAPKPAGIFDRIKAGLLSQVDVRATGTVPADAAPVINRARGKAAAGDLAGAVAELQGLSPEQRSVLAPFSEAVAARMAGVDAVRRIEAEALAATARKS